ncbi:hypothetical protein CBL_09358 [Carabus blaptoides fortunei]
MTGGRAYSPTMCQHASSLEETASVREESAPSDVGDVCVVMATKQDRQSYGFLMCSTVLSNGQRDNKTTNVTLTEYSGLASGRKLTRLLSRAGTAPLFTDHYHHC